MIRFFIASLSLLQPLHAYAQEDDVYSICLSRLQEEPDDAFCSGYTLGYVAGGGIGTFVRGAAAPAIAFWQGDPEAADGADIAILAPTNPNAELPEGLPVDEGYLYRLYSVDEFAASGFAELYGLGESSQEVTEALSGATPDVGGQNSMGRAAEVFGFEGASRLAIIPPVEAPLEMQGLEKME